MQSQIPQPKLDRTSDDEKKKKYSSIRSKMYLGKLFYHRFVPKIDHWVFKTSHVTIHFASTSLVQLDQTWPNSIWKKNYQVLAHSSFSVCNRSLPTLTEFNGLLLSFTEFYWVLLGLTGFYWVLLGFTGFYWVLPSFTGFYWDLWGWIEFYRVLLVFYRVLPGFTGFYWVLIGFAVVTAIIYRRRVLEAVNEWIFCSHPRRPFSFSSLDTTKKAERTRTEKRKNGRNRKRTPTTNKKKTPQKETTGASSLSIVLAFDRSIRRLNWSMVFFFWLLFNSSLRFCIIPPPLPFYGLEGAALYLVRYWTFHRFFLYFSCRSLSLVGNRVFESFSLQRDWIPSAIVGRWTWRPFLRPINGSISICVMLCPFCNVLALAEMAIVLVIEAGLDWCFLCALIGFRRGREQNVGRRGQRRGAEKRRQVLSFFLSFSILRSNCFVLRPGIERNVRVGRWNRRRSELDQWEER